MKTRRNAAALVIVVVCLARFGWSQSTLKDNSLPGKEETPKSYQIMNKKHGDLLRPKDANGSDGTPIVLYSAQLWKCLTWKLTATGESEFIVQNHFTSKSFAMASDGKGNPVIQVPLPKDTAKAIRWRFVKLADGAFRIADPKSVNVLTAVKGENDDEVRIALLPWDEKDEQKWELKQIDPAKLTM
jgi:hypothetical protein